MSNKNLLLGIGAFLISTGSLYYDYSVFMDFNLGVIIFLAAMTYYFMVVRKNVIEIYLPKKR